MISTPVGPSTGGGCLAGDLNTWERLAVIKNRVCHALKTHPISLLYREMFFFYILIWHQMSYVPTFNKQF